MSERFGRRTRGRRAALASSRFVALGVFGYLMMTLARGDAIARDDGSTTEDSNNAIGARTDVDDSIAFPFVSSSASSTALSPTASRVSALGRRNCRFGLNCQVFMYDNKADRQRSACSQCQRNGVRPRYSYTDTYCIGWSWKYTKESDCTSKDPRTEYATCPSNPCVDCQGEWSPWKSLAEFAYDAEAYPENSQIFPTVKSSFDKDAFCGTYTRYRQYKVTTPQGPAGSHACPHRNGEKKFEYDVKENCEEPRFEITNPAKFVASNAYDFGIAVYHDKLCGPGTPCHSSSAKTADNVLCDVVVRQKDAAAPEYGRGTSLPFKSLDGNFIDPETKTRNIRLTTDGVLKAGDYVIEYDCSIRYFKIVREENLRSMGYYSETYYTYPVSKIYYESKINGSHEFKLVKGCEHALPLDADKSLLATHLLLTSPEYLSVKCDALRNTQESLFRRYDNAPTDGVLDATELVDAFDAHGADSSMLKNLMAENRTLSLSLGEIMQAVVIPFHCEQPLEQPVRMTKVTLPSVASGRETTAGECRDGAQAVAVQWDFDDQKFETGDAVCAYMDGVLIESNEPTKTEPEEARKDFFTKFSDGVYALRGIKDDRQMFGANDDVQATLLAQYTFDDYGENDVRIESASKIFPARLTMNEAQKTVKIVPCESPMTGKCMQSDPAAKGLVASGTTRKLCNTGWGCAVLLESNKEIRKKQECSSACSRDGLQKKYTYKAKYCTSWAVTWIKDISTCYAETTDTEYAYCPPSKLCDDHDDWVYGGKGALAYVDVSLQTSFAFSMWVYIPSSSTQRDTSFFASSPSHSSKAGTFLFWGRESSLYIMAITTKGKDETAQLNFIVLPDAFDESGWYLIGFSFLERNRGVSMFSYPLDKTKNATTMTSPKLSLIDFLSCFDDDRTIAQIVSNDNVATQFRDVRFYSGVVQHETFEAVRQCGEKSFCARLARTAPGARRVVCVTTRVKGETPRQPACTSTLYYDGTAIDVQPSMDIAGVTFSFRDTAWDETAFEIERYAYGVSGGAFETVVSIGNNLKGCASVFNSITYLDRQAAEVPYTQWTYRLVSKFDRELPNQLMHLVSKTVNFTTPWTSVIEGNVFAGGSTTPVPYVRVCAEFKKKIDNGAIAPTTTTMSAMDLAQNKRVSHSNAALATVAHQVTSTQSAHGHVSLSKDEFLRVDLGAWSSVESISVCATASGADATALEQPPHVQAYVHDTEADLNRKNHGHMCLFTSPQWKLGTNTNVTCAKFSCIGSKIKSFHGQFVDVVATTTDGVQIIKVHAFGNETKCRFAATTDADGRYELNIQDSTSNIPIKSKLHIGAYKEEINAPELVEIELDGEPEHGFFFFRNVSDARPWPYGHGTPWDFVTDDDWADRATVEAQLSETFISAVTGSGDDDSTAAVNEAQVLITDLIWNKTFDVNGDGKVHVKEARYILEQLDDDAGTKTNFVFEPLIVFPLFDASDITPEPFGEFHATADASGCENVLLVYRDSETLPETPAEWRELYQTSVDEYTSTIRDDQRTGSAKCHDITPERRVNTTVAGSPSKFILPMITWLPGSRKAPLISPLKLDDMDAYEIRIVSSMQLRAMQRRPDIIHVFDKPPKLTQTDASTESFDETAEVDIIENIFSSSAMTKRTIVDVKHKRVEEKDFTDDTTVIIKGAVLFPSSRVDASTACGLSSAIIEVIDAEGSVETHKTDIKGNFKLALTRGKTFVLRAKYQDHFICYAGDTVEMAVTDAQGCASLERKHYTRLLVNNDDAEKTYPHSAHRLLDVSDDHFVYFTDVTRSKIDLGVYQGECEKKYSGIKYSITPTNGCHGAVEVDHDVLMNDRAPSEGDVEYSWWPYAAMEYKIRLVDAPSVAFVPDLIKDEPYASGCTTESNDVLDIQTYFEEKAEDIKVLKMQDEVNGVSARYKYHGHFCVYIMDIPAIDDETLICYDKTEPTGTLTHQHFLGTTNYTNFAQNIDGAEKLVRVQVFEVHGSLDANGENDIKTCSVFPSNELGTGSTTVKFRQDVTDEANNPCHSKRAGGPLCDFALQLDPNSKQVLFPLEGGGSESATLIASGTPNLVAPFRRNVRFKVTRDDNWTPISIEVKRHLISLGSKVRGSKYELSDNTNWATVPIDGLVYTVVHDPPGGDSYAELATESRIGLEFELAGVRAASQNRETGAKSKMHEKFEINPGFNAGYVAEGELSMPINMLEVEGEFEFGTSGPKFEMQSTNSSGWSLETTTNRVLRSSQDVALPGRSGDAILGGGIELVYKISDVLDVQMDGSSKDCLLVKPYITWLPRKPTSYVFIVATIEQQVLPNLRFLLSTVLAGGVLEDSSDMAFPCDANGDDNTGPIDKCTQKEIINNWSEYLAERIYGWERTLQWSSPSIFKLVKGEGESKQEKKTYKSIERISAPMDDVASVFGQNMAAKTKYFTDTFIDTPMNDVMEDLSKTWDASFWMMPFNGIGPPVMFGGAKIMDAKIMDPGNTRWSIGDEYWEPAKTILETETSDETIAKIHGTEAQPIGKQLKILAGPAANKLLQATDVRPGIIDVLKSSSKESIKFVGQSAAGIKHLWKKTSWEKARAAAKAANAKRLAAATNNLAGALNNLPNGDFIAPRSSFAKGGMKVKLEAATNGAATNGDFIAKRRPRKPPNPAEVAEKAAEAKKLQGKTKAFVKKAGKSAAKVLIGASVVAAFEVYKNSVKGTTYPYISYPRELYRDSIPTAQSAFYDGDDENVGDEEHVGNKMYSWGMMTSSVNDLMSEFQACPNSAISCTEEEYASEYNKDQLLPFDPNLSLGEDGNIAPDYDERVVASFTGGKAMTGMKVRGTSGAHEDTILLTFSGGGHSVEFSFSSEESTSKNHYDLHVSLHGEASNAHDLRWSGLLGLPIQLGLASQGIDDKQKWTFTKDMSYDRSFFWNKYGKLSTLYSLGDPHLGDKFVVQVASDTRFGTPVFITKGGRSLCPGEPFTVWREAGIEFMPLESMELTDLNPDDRAILVLSIKNEAMHREAAPLGLRLVDGLTETVHKIVDVAYANADAFREAEDVLRSVQDVTNKSVAWDAPVVEKMVKAAQNAVDANKTAFEAAADVNEASVDAPALGSEMHDLEFLVMYEWLPPLGDVVPLKFSDGDSLRSQQHVRKTSFTMSIGRGPTALAKLKYIRLQLVSLCEFDLSASRNFNREPIGDTISLGTISWLTSCPEVSFTKKTLQDHEATQYISKQQPDEPIFEFGVNFDASSDNLEKVLLQYRKPGEEWDAWRRTDGEQMNLKTNFIEKGGLFKWNINDNKLLSGFNDGEYEVRAKSFCTGGSNAIPSTQFAITSEVLTLVVDTTPPLALRRDVYDDYTYSIVFSEAIDCSNIALSLTKTNSRCAGDAEGDEMSLEQTSVESVAEVRCSGSNIVAVSFTDEAWGAYAVDISNIADLSGNAMKQHAVKFDANVNCDLAKKAQLSPEERAAARVLERALERQNARRKKKAAARLGEFVQYASFKPTNQSIAATMALVLFCVVAVGAAVRIRDRSIATMKKPAAVQQSYGAVSV